MPSICFYFQVHQPYRLRDFGFRRIGQQDQYFDDEKNAAIMRKVAQKCYLPANRTMLDLIRRHEGRFRISYSISGVAIDQMREYAPEVLDSFIELANTGCVEFLGETYYHSLSSVYDLDEFREQVAMHSRAIEQLFGQRPRVFRNTELVYSDRIGQAVADMGFSAMLAEGADDILDWRSPNYVYRVRDRDMRLLLKNYRLSDDIAFRFSNRGWQDYPLTADKFASWVHKISGAGEVVNLFMDYETFGEHQWQETGIFDFLQHMPDKVMQHPDWDFATPSEVVGRYQPVSEMSFGRLVSWADTERDLTAWQGNNMQKRSLAQAHALAQAVKARNNPALLDTWRRLLTSDHAYYMCTKWFADGDVHAYFSPYESPYEAFLTYTNVISDFRNHVLASGDLLSGTEQASGAGQGSIAA
jgi:alpha-amylase